MILWMTSINLLFRIEILKTQGSILDSIHEWLQGKLFRLKRRELWVELMMAIFFMNSKFVSGINENKIKIDSICFNVKNCTKSLVPCRQTLVCLLYCIYK